MSQDFNILKLSGLEIAKGMLDGSVPLPDTMPVTMNYKFVDVRGGGCTFEGRPQASHKNISQHIHGGWGMTILDSAAVLSVVTKLPRGILTATSTFEAKFMRPLKEDVLYRAAGEVIAVGKTLAHSRAQLIDVQSEKIMMSCTCTTSLLDYSDKIPK